MRRMTVDKVRTWKHHIHFANRVRLVLYYIFTVRPGATGMQAMSNRLSSLQATCRCSGGVSMLILRLWFFAHITWIRVDSYCPRVACTYPRILQLQSFVSGEDYPIESRLCEFSIFDLCVFFRNDQPSYRFATASPFIDSPRRQLVIGQRLLSSWRR